MPSGARETPVPADGDIASYQLIGKVDGAGEVYEAHHPRFSVPFVIKLFPRAAVEGPEAIKAFGREAGRVSILRHPHIVHVLDSGVLVDRTPFLAMERLTGQSLEERLAQQGAVPLPQLLPILRGIVSALSAAHAAGVFHREIRADNVFLADHADGGAGVAKVLDFGVSQLTWAAHAAARGVGATAARYLAPEQVLGALTAVDARTDVFALAALTYRMLSGVDAFPAAITANTLDNWAANRPRPVIPSVRGVSAVDAVLYKAMEKHPDNRYPSVAAFY
ncbi:MAG: serine/threonine-protein kinase, partial [Pseudomonadota bacterium]